MDAINAQLDAGNIGGAWQLAEQLEARTIPYTEFLAKYVWIRA